STKEEDVNTKQRWTSEYTNILPSALHKENNERLYHFKMGMSEVRAALWQMTVVVVLMVVCLSSASATVISSRSDVMECEAPDSIPHGSVQVLVKESFFVGARRQKETEENMFLRASGVRQEEQGRGEERFPEGSVAEYSCGPGYCLHPAPRASRTCHRGTWLGELPQCVHISLLDVSGLPLDNSEPTSVSPPWFTNRRRGGAREESPFLSPLGFGGRGGISSENNNKSVCQTHTLSPQHHTAPSTPRAHLYELVKERCSNPEPVVNGYYLEVTGSSDHEYPPGARLQFVCHTGYILRGPDAYMCNKAGEWEPRRRPLCMPSAQLIGSELCRVAPEIKNTVQKLVRGMVTTGGAVSGTKIGYRCRAGFRYVRAPCVTHILTCHQGQWHGTSPECEEFSSCVAPPNIAHGFMYDSASSYPLQSQVYYACEPGYRLMGPSVLTCEEDSGCWTPRMPAVCERIREYDDEMHDEKPLLDMHTILVATTGSVIGIFLIVMALILYQRALSPKLVRLRNSGSGGELPPPPHTCPPTAPQPPQDHDPDRLALIAYPDELPQQGVPPTYEEAVRQRPAAVMFEPHGGSGGRYAPHGHRSRGHRVVVPGVRRSRHRDNPDNISYQSIGSARQSSSWSACDSLGSTDTVAVSDSTNVTVETQSSGGTSSSSASQAPSCRALAGSLASFDTSSLVNNEGAPLLEENEGDDGCEQRRTEDQYSLSTRDSDSIKDNVSHTRSVTVSLQE
ncbi:hypothetical protein Pcinc_042055, partial [Petrolisthes cinctipes]